MKQKFNDSKYYKSERTKHVSSMAESVWEHDNSANFPLGKLRMFEAYSYKDYVGEYKSHANYITKQKTGEELKPQLNEAQFSQLKNELIKSLNKKKTNAKEIKRREDILERLLFDFSWFYNRDKFLLEE
jgi:hypothetical protein